MRLGVALALLTLVLDQASKLWVLFGARLGEAPPVAVTPFLDLTLVWNRGISYGLFQMSDAAGRWLLVGLTALATLAMGVWLARTRDLMTAAGLGLIVGGAAGNLIDRVWWGAVVDFVHFHVGDFSWYVFNVADAAIVAGVLLLLPDSFRRPGGEGAAPH
ncbi:signal peptidase II [Camelimonas abortus]|uniref:Lipoprotein signal peptidase n=1 Tax=Camelimonas abortus TaxID=1017184 RepID=A0ABV7LFE1_9HYPH